MSEEKKSCPCKCRKWLIPVIAAAAALVIALGAMLLLGGDGQKLYWNVDRMEFSQNGREADEQGIYWFRMAVDGQIRELKVTDKTLAESIDNRNVMCLDVDKNGVVTALSDPQGLQSVARKLYIKRTDGNTVYANGSMALNGKDYTLELTDKTAIYDVMPGTEDLGQPLKVSDLVMTDALVAYTDETGAVAAVFVTARSGSANIYWRANRNWNAGARKTGRVPDANGVYTVEMCLNGQVETVKCMDEALVTQIDKASDAEAAFCFTFNKEGFITQVRDIRVGAHGIRVCSGYVVREANGKTFTAANPESVMATFKAELPAECGVYDVSPAAFRDGRAGQAVENLQVGDKVYVWADADGTPLTVYIQQRKLDLPVYRIYPMCFYDTGSRQTTRVSDGEGWYKIQLVKLGEPGVKTFRTKDRDLVTFIDSQQTTQLVALELDGDVITQAYSSSSVYGGSVVNKGRYVAQVVGCMMTVMRIGGKGPAISMVSTENCKVYDFSGDLPVGSETELRRGDVIEAQVDLFGQVAAIVVTRRGVIN